MHLCCTTSIDNYMLRLGYHASALRCVAATLKDGGTTPRVKCRAVRPQPLALQ
jgi:hypothetical protein